VTLAVGAVARLAELHAAGFVHRDIKPANLLVGPDGDLRLCDFDLSAPIRGVAAGAPLEDLEGTLHYISPEQTGRTERPVDHRTDFYSLGATLVELLTGRPPFSTNDPAELIHAHLAREPEDVRARRPDCPPALAAILRRLLAKSPDDRYRSATGLLADLRRCAALLAAGEVADFEPGRDDVPQRLILPERLYGRDVEVAQLVAAFEASRHGVVGMLLVTGPSGIGKSALVAAARQPVRTARGFFAAGKFEKLKRGAPYVAWSRALGDLVTQLLVGPAAQIEATGCRIADAVGPNGALLLELVPDLEALIGPREPVAELGPNEAAARLNALWRSFLACLGTSEHPLVIFLDDLQWADAASLELLLRLVRDRAAHHLLVIGSYRNSEVDGSHPLKVAIDRLRTVTAVPQIHLGPLGGGPTARLLGDALHLEPAVVREFVDLVHTKTGGNPFFLRRFVEDLYDDGLLKLDPGEGRWRWDADGIARRPSTDNVVELMAGSIDKLPLASQELIRLASVAGARFELQALAAIAERDPRLVGEALDAAVGRGLLVVEHAAAALDPRQVTPRPAVYRFAHDRIQEAAYESVPPEDRPALHLRIGRILRERTTDESVFEAAGHLNRGRHLLESSSERLELARLDLAAGQQARTSGAYEAGGAYLEVAWELLGDDPWTARPDLAETVRLAQFELASLGEEEGSEVELRAELLEHVTDPGVRGRVFAGSAGYRIGRGWQEDELQASVEFLREFGVRLSTAPTMGTVARELGPMLWRMKRLGPDGVAALPVAEDPRIEGAMRILHIALIQAILTNPLMVPVVCFEVLRLTLRHGVTPTAPVALAVWALIITSFRDVDVGFPWIDAGEALSARLGHPEHRETSPWCCVCSVGPTSPLG